MEIGLQNIKTIKDLQLYLFELDKIKCCQGSMYSTSYPEIKKSFGIQYIESNGKWWHAKCTTIINDNR